jgi:hypothetical protein
MAQLEMLSFSSSSVNNFNFINQIYSYEKNKIKLYKSLDTSTLNLDFKISG